MAAKSCSSCCSPLFLRLALGVVFIWAGLGKVVTTMPVKGEAAATLANMGVMTPTTTKVTTPPATPTTPTTPPANKDTKPASEPASKPHSSRPVPVEPLPPSGKTPTPKTSTPPALMAVFAAKSSVGKAYTADDFPDEVQVRGVYGLSLMLKQDAATVDADGKPAKPIWPDFLAKDNWPVYMAWACAGTELVGGLFVLVGALTRFSALGLAGVMATAMWLTQFGPAYASGHNRWGFFPAHPWFGTMDWMTMMFQFVLMMSALAVVGLGCGRLGIDRMLFPPPTPPAPKPKPENAPAH